MLLGLLIAGLDSFSDQSGHLRAALMLTGAVIVGAIFVARERRLAVPMLPVDLLRLPVFALSMMTSICSFAAQNMAFIALPFFFERALGHSESVTGFQQIPGAGLSST